MDKKQIELAVNDLYSSVPKVEEAMENAFHQTFACFERVGAYGHQFRLFFDLENDCIELVFNLLSNSKCTFFGNFVQLNRNSLEYRSRPILQKKEKDAKNNKIYDISKVFIEKVSELNSIRLKVLTGTVEISENFFDYKLY